MRVMLFALILSFMFSGFSAAAHAFTNDSCDPAAISKSVDFGNDECFGHQPEPDQSKDSPSNDVNKDNAAKSKCLDCVHCCSGHVFNTTDYSINIAIEDNKLFPIYGEIAIGEHHFSLLRPPKSFV